MDGNIEILHVKIKEKIQGLMEQKISEWQEDDIYAISLYVFNEEDDPCRPVAAFGYNTERQVQKVSQRLLMSRRRDGIMPSGCKIMKCVWEEMRRRRISGSGSRN